MVMHIKDLLLLALCLALLFFIVKGIDAFELRLPLWLLRVIYAAGIFLWRINDPGKYVVIAYIDMSHYH
jgi:hypothetical protein